MINVSPREKVFVFSTDVQAREADMRKLIDARSLSTFEQSSTLCVISLNNRSSDGEAFTACAHAILRAVWIRAKYNRMSSTFSTSFG